MKYIIFSLLLFSNVVFAGTTENDLFRCVQINQNKALKISKGIVGYDNIVKLIKNDDKMLTKYTKEFQQCSNALNEINAKKDTINTCCGSVFSDALSTNFILQSEGVISIETPLAGSDKFQNKILNHLITEGESYLLYDITEQYYIFQKEHVTPVNKFILMPKNKTLNGYKYDYGNYLSHGESQKGYTDGDIRIKIFYKVKGMKVVHNRNTRVAINSGLILEPVILK